MFTKVRLYDRDKVEEIGLESVAETSLRAGLPSGILLHRVYCSLVFKFTVASPIIVFLKAPYFEKSLHFVSFPFVHFLYLLLPSGQLHFWKYPLFCRKRHL